MARTLDDAVRDGLAYRWNFLIADIDAGDTVALLKRTGERRLRIHSIIIEGGNVTSVYDIHKQAAAATAPAGTAVSAVSLNTENDTGQDSGAVAKADETGYSTQGTILEEANILANERHVIDMHNMALALNEAIAIDQVTESTAGGVTIVGWFE